VRFLHTHSARKSELVGCLTGTATMSLQRRDQVLQNSLAVRMTVPVERALMALATSIDNSSAIDRARFGATEFRGIEIFPPDGRNSDCPIG
jgi:hypothetical protein